MSIKLTSLSFLQILQSYLFDKKMQFTFLHMNKPGNLDLSRHFKNLVSTCRESLNTLKKRHLNCQESLDTLKKDFLTVEKFSTLRKRTSRQSLCPKVLIVFNVSIKTLDHDSLKRTSRHVEKVSTL
jgi:hypothetical protein